MNIFAYNFPVSDCYDFYMHFFTFKTVRYFYKICLQNIYEWDFNLYPVYFNLFLNFFISFFHFFILFSIFFVNYFYFFWNNYLKLDVRKTLVFNNFLFLLINSKIFYFCVHFDYKIQTFVFIFSFLDKTYSLLLNI